jgi:CRP-like cAMP-binding protein
MPEDSNLSTDSHSSGPDGLPSEFKRSTVLEADPDRVWQIQSGIVKPYTLNQDGVLTTLGYLTTGDFVGASLSNVFPFEMLCVTDVVARCVPIELTHELLNSLISQLAMTQQLLAVQGHRRVQERLKNAFLLLSTKFGKEVETGRIIELPMTHQEMGDLIGSSRVTVTKAIHALKAQGWLFQVQKNYALSRLAIQEASTFPQRSSA